MHSLYIVYIYLTEFLSKHSLFPSHSPAKETSLRKVAVRLRDLNFIYNCLLILDLVLSIVSQCMLLVQHLHSKNLNVVLLFLDPVSLDGFLLFFIPIYFLNYFVFLL